MAAMKLSVTLLGAIRGGQVQLNGFYFIYLVFIVWCVFVGGQTSRWYVEVAEGIGQQNDHTILQFLHMGEKEDNEEVEIVTNKIRDCINNQNKAPFHKNSLIFRLKAQDSPL